MNHNVVILMVQETNVVRKIGEDFVASENLSLVQEKPEVSS